MNWRDFSIEGVLVRLVAIWRRHELNRVLAKVTENAPPMVQRGPFKGLRFPRSVDLVLNLQKVLGSYELELNPVIERLILQSFATVINIGAAEGYYAVGMAMRLPQAKVFAFEMDEAARQRCAETVRLNRVDSRVTVLGKCDTQSLVTLPIEEALLVVDCEGAELDILSEEISSRLTGASLLVELHDALRPGCSRTIWQRFGKTHDMKFITAEPREAQQFPVLNGLRSRQQELALYENRLGIQEWVVMRPKAAVHPDIPLNDD